MIPILDPAPPVHVQPSDTVRDYVESRLGFTERPDDDDDDVLTSGEHRSSLPQLGDTMRPVNNTLSSGSRLRSSLLKPLPPFEEVQCQVMPVSSSAPLTSDECGACCDQSTRYWPWLEYRVSCTDARKQRSGGGTPDLLELSTMYENIYKQTLTRTQSGPVSRPESRPRWDMRHWSRYWPLITRSVMSEQRPWTDGGGKAKPRQLEPLFQAPGRHLIIPKQRGLGGLHLSCNYSRNNKVLEPITGKHSLDNNDFDK